VTSMRLWVALLTLTTFLAGLACGTLLSAWLVPPRTAPDPGPFHDYERMLVDTFKLPPERQVPLHALLVEYEHQVERNKDKHMADYMSAMESELSDHGIKLREQIRDRVLPEAQRPEFDRLASALPQDRP
jgi:hypothetical protein